MGRRGEYVDLTASGRGGLRMEFDVTVEIPKGSRNKYVIDRTTGRIRLDRTLFTATQYPVDYGYVEDTFGAAHDGDALDAAVLVQEPTFPGCLIRCRAIGIFRMRDEQGPTPKVLCVPTADLRLAHLADITDLDRFYRLEIQHFFTVYKLIEPRKTVHAESIGWGGRADAEDEIRLAYERGRRAGG
jgi:inorganic pyrophosphatase